MIHGLAIRKGGISILCNGQPHESSGNHYKGSYKELVEAIDKTSDGKTRLLVPQESLDERVTCNKCTSLIDPSKRKIYMRKIYANSSRWKKYLERKAENKFHRNHNNVDVLQNLNAEPIEKPLKAKKSFEISGGKRLHIIVEIL